MQPPLRTSSPLPGVLVRRIVPLSALALLAVGCADIERIPRTHPVFSGADTASRTQREAEMNRRWQHKSLDELVSTLGKPRMTMAIPGGGNPPGFAVVYGVDAGTGCIDAFAVNVGEAPTVRIYYCR